MATATLNGHTATHVRVSIPAWGLWYADVTLARDTELAGQVTLQLADLTLTGTVLTGGSYASRSWYRIVAGAGGWGREIPEKGYANDAGVKKATILTDAALAASETLDASTVPAPSETVGPAWVRPQGPASRVLEQLSPRTWYVGEDGVTRIGRRPAVVITAAATRTAVRPDADTIELASDSLAALVPGATVDGLEAVDVEHSLTPDGLRSTIWGNAPTTRRLAAWRELVHAVAPSLRFLGVHEYRVVSQEGERLNLQPVRVSRGMPVLRRAMVRPGIPGARGDVALGSRVLVAFVDQSPSSPVVLAFEHAEAPGFPPDRLDLVGEDDTISAFEAAGRALRFGDVIMMPVGAAGTPTPIAIVGNPSGTFSASRVRP